MNTLRFQIAECPDEAKEPENLVALCTHCTCGGTWAAKPGVTIQVLGLGLSGLCSNKFRGLGFNPGLKVELDIQSRLSY